MPALKDVQRQLHEMFRGERPPEEVAAFLGTDPRRTAIYRNFVLGHIMSVLRKNYPIARSLLGEAAWDELTSDFYDRVPAWSWELNSAAQPFGDYLAHRLDGGDTRITPFMVCLSRLEWEEFAVFVDPERMPDPGGLDAPALNPTLSILSLEFPVVEYAKNWTENAAPAPTPEAIDPPETVLLFRHPRKMTSIYSTASDDLLFAVKVVHENIPLADAAEISGQSLEDCEAALRNAIDLGLLIEPA